MTSTDQPAQGSTVDYCWRWPQEGHSWTWTKHAGLPTVSTRTCFVCRYVDVTEVQDALRRHELDRDRLLGEVASLTAERDRLREALLRMSAAPPMVVGSEFVVRELPTLRKERDEARAERDAALASLTAEREQTARMRALLESIRLVHARNEHFPHYCRSCRAPWPCRTVALIDTAMESIDRPAVDALDAGVATGGEDGTDG